MKQVNEVKATFEFIPFTHVYFEFNTRADMKKAIMQEGTLLVHEYREGSLISKSEKSLYKCFDDISTMEDKFMNVCKVLKVSISFQDKL